MILLTCFLSMLVVLLIYWQSVPDSSIKNGFSRKIVDVQLTLVQRVKLRTNSFNFAGRIGASLFLHDVDRPFQLIQVKNERIYDTLFLKNDQSNDIRHAQVQIDSPFFFMADLDRYKVYRGTVSGWRVDKDMQSPAFFSEYLALNDSAILYRTVTPTSKEYRLIIRQGGHIIDGTGLIQKQIDGLFCTDGMVRFDKNTQTILYTYFYRNQFIKANTDLRLIARYQTIDTNSVAKISVAHHTKENSSTLATPPTLVNLAAECYRDEVFIRSNLMADNEDRARFNKSDVIDVYNLNSGVYRYSFYIPRQDKFKVTHFTFHQNTLVVIRSNTLEIYNLLPI